jgi:hypothetical protein
MVCDDFRTDPSVNPRTGRKIKIGGPVYARLARECGVPANAAERRRILLNAATRARLPVNAEAERRRKLNAATKVPLPTKCLGAGIGQRTNTCWFNSALNGLALSDKTSRVLLEMAKKLPRNGAVIPAACPLRPTKKYILQYVRDLYDGVNMTKRGNGGLNRSVDVMKTAFTPGRLSSAVQIGREGHYSVDAIETLMKRCFGKDGYRYVRPKTTNTLVEDYTARSQPFLVIEPQIIVRNTNGTPKLRGWNKLSEVPLTLGKDPAFGEHTLAHAVYIIKREEDGAGEHGMHAVVAYTCGGKKFVYDANQRNALEIDWSERKNEKRLLEYSSVGFPSKFTFMYTVDYALYVNY